jgi:hypothetical protein
MRPWLNKILNIDEVLKNPYETFTLIHICLEIYHLNLPKKINGRSSNERMQTYDLFDLHNA